MGIQHARQARHRARHYESEQFHPRRVDAERGGPQLIVRDRAHEGANGRFENDVHQQQAQPGDDRERIVVGDRANVTIERGNREPKVAARELVVGGQQNAECLGERPGRDRQIDGAHLEHENADQKAGEPRGDHAERQAHPKRRF